MNVLRIASRPLFLAVAMLLLTLSVSFGMFPSTLPPHLQRTLHVSEGGVGSVYAVVAVRGRRVSTPSARNTSALRKKPHLVCFIFSPPPSSLSKYHALNASITSSSVKKVLHQFQTYR